MDHLSTKELVDEVAKRHGIMLDEKDPILVTLTLNEIIIENYIKAVEASISKINARQIENAQNVGIEIVTKGANFLVNEIAEAKHLFGTIASNDNIKEAPNLDSGLLLLSGIAMGAFLFWLGNAIWKLFYN
jgi:hypothetical protein